MPGVKATPGRLWAPRYWWNWPGLYDRWRKVKSTSLTFTGVTKLIKCVNNGGDDDVWTFHTLFYQMGSGPGGVWCLPAGTLESMGASAPPSGWRSGWRFLHQTLGSTRAALQMSPFCFSGLHVLHQQESFHLHQSGWGRHGSVPLTAADYPST